MVNFKIYRAALLGAVSSAAFAASPALAVPMLTAEAETAPNFGMGDSESSMAAPVAAASASFLGGGNDGFAFATANEDYETRINGGVNGSGTASATAALSETVTNTSAVTRDYFFSFQINGGSVVTDSNDFGVVSTDEARAAFAADVRVDGSSIWNVGVAVALSDEVFSLEDGNGDDDGTLLGFSSFVTDEVALASWSTSIFTVEIGTLAPGGSLDLDYILSGEVEATLANFCSFEEVDDGYGLCSFTNFSASDPAGVASLGITSTEVAGPPTSVPEPASLALLGIGLAGLGLKRRCRFEL